MLVLVVVECSSPLDDNDELWFWFSSLPLLFVFSGVLVLVLLNAAAANDEPTAGLRSRTCGEDAGNTTLHGDNNGLIFSREDEM